MEMQVKVCFSALTKTNQLRLLVLPYTVIRTATVFLRKHKTCLKHLCRPDIAILRVILYGCKVGLSDWGRNTGWGCSRKRRWEGYLGLIGTGRRLHNEDLYDLQSSPKIIQLIRTRMRKAGHTACKSEKTGSYRVLKDRDHLENRGVDERIILKWIFKKWNRRGRTTGLLWLKIQTGGRRLWMR